ncbi:MAG: hypothetical protein IT184_13625 [Acidobacteria bacterium]|nr:hypothetical protein [Acidobacteriota bacterium]
MILPARLLPLTFLVMLAAVVATAGVAQHAMTAKFDGSSEWDLDGNGTWAMRPGMLALEKAGVPGGPIRRPGAMAIFRSPVVTDFIADIELRSTAPVDLLVRDVLLIFGYESPMRFYYVHLAAKTDGVHNGIFLVDHADRRRIDAPSSTARLTDQRWHRVRLERRGSTGAIRVFFDDDPIPMLSAIDGTIASGRVGVGSFDETAEFRAFTLRDLSATPPR